MFCSVLTRTRMFSVALALLGLAVATPGSARDFEVWLVDQSDSFGKTYGGTVYIYAGADVNGADASSATPTDVLDLAGATAARCFTQTGANPVRPHMLSFNANHSHAILTFVTSGHVVVFEAATRTPVACVRTSVGAGGQRQAHAAQPTPDDSYILVSNQNGKRLDRITTNYATNTFVLDATLDLANGVTPNGVLREFAGRPDNAPILVVPDATSTLAFVTLRGGGLFVVNPTTTPMEILAEYDKTKVHANGFGGVEANGRMYINSGAGAAGTNPSQFDVYRFPLSGYAASNPPNTPAPAVVFSDDTVPPAPERDAHGLVATTQNRYIWVFDRALSVAEVFDTASDAHVNTVALAHTLNPTPDLADISPSGDRIFVSLRGPNPLSGSPHAATGFTPGLGVIQVQQGGKGGEIKGVVKITNVDTAGVERADAHGIRVRLSAPEPDTAFDIGGSASNIGSGRDNGSVRVSGRFTASSPIALNRATLVLADVLDDGGELVLGAGGQPRFPLSLQPRAGSTVRAAIFETPSGPRPSVRVEVKTRDASTGRMEFLIVVDRATIPRHPASCAAGGSTAQLRTRFNLAVDGTTVASVHDVADWRCGSKDLRTP